jgi:hypothetical protein
MVAGAERRVAKDAIIGFVIGVVLFLGACWWDARLQARQDALASANRGPSGWPGPRLGQSG